MLTLGAAKSHVEACLGGVPAVDTSANLVTQAGQWFYEVRAWNFRRRLDVAVNLAEGEPVVAVPGDFGELEAARDGEGLPLTVVDAPEMLRRGPLSLGAETGRPVRAVAVEWSLVSGVPTPRLRVTPTPSVDVTGGLRLDYLSRWVTPAGDTDALPLTPQAEPAYLAVLRAYAMSVDEDETEGLGGGVSRRLAEVQAGAVFQAAVRGDSRGNNVIGRLDDRRMRARGWM